METGTPDRLAVLGHPQRFAVFRLLMRRYPHRIPAGEQALALGIKPSTLSTYLSALQRAGLVTQERAGTSLLYAIDMSAVQQMFQHLFWDCCRGRPELCPDVFATPDPALSKSNPHTPISTSFSTGSTTMTDRKYNVLFICVGNSARSIFAESLLRDLAGDTFNAYSAGTRPYSELNSFAVQVLADKGHDTTQLRSKNVVEFSGPDAPELDFVFTVCNQAANEECPAWEGQPISGHWGMPDPVKVDGTDAEKALAFQHTYGALKRRIQAFTALPMDSLDRLAMQSAVDEIGRNTAEDLT